MSWTGSLKWLTSGISTFDVDPPADRFIAVQRKLHAMDDDMSRFNYALMASCALHAIVLFGITIRPPDLSKLDSIAPELEVVLVNAKSPTRPLKADVLAQHNLDGGGNTDAARRAKTPLPVLRDEKQTTELKLESRRVAQLEEEAKKLLTQVQSPTKVDASPPQPQPQPQPQPRDETKIAPNAAELIRRSLEIARLEGQIAKEMDLYQKRPRRTFIGARAKEYRFARYIDDWRLKIERIGTLNYPQAARDQKIYGSLRLTVSIRQDGTVENIEINQSSGHKILDEAAIRIVKLAGPYAALPADITKDTDILGITRTWTFTTSDQLSTE